MFREYDYSGAHNSQVDDTGLWRIINNVSLIYGISSYIYE